MRSGTLVELAQARATRVQAASGVISARYSLVFQTSLMSYYTGELDPEHVLV
jgi:outer membrane protein